MKKLIQNGTIVTACDEYVADILIEGGKIAAIGKNLECGAAEVVDATGCYILPGGIDQHVHFSFEFNGAKVRGFETSSAAALGGTTTVIEFVNQKKGQGLLESMEQYRKEQVDGLALVDYNLHGIITDPRPEVFEEMASLVAAGYTTVKLFMAYKGMFFHADDDAILKALQAAKKVGVTVMVHAENAEAIDVFQKELLAQGKTEPYSHVLSRPPLVEAEATRRAIYLSQLAQAPIYIVHVSCTEAMDEVKKAYTSGLPVRGETCSHYLVLDDKKLALPDFEGAKYVCSPPLRSVDHHDSLWEALRMGWLNAVSSDHCGFDWKVQKHLGKDSFVNIPNGAPGMEHRLAILWTYGVAQGRITRQQLVELYATEPARNTGIDYCKGHIGIGFDADLVVFDPNWKGMITNKRSLQGVDYTPYEGMAQIGRAEKVFLRGEMIVDGGEYIGKEIKGQRVMGKPFGASYR
jgi:dihydropyrimidinase